jgi:hypothetical protein
MSSLEKIVRPFQAGDVFRARLLPPNQTPFVIPADNPVTWEGRADGTYTELQPEMQTNFKVEFNEVLDKRQSKLMKVVNPDDNNQKVFIERIDQATFKDKLTGKEETFNYDWSKSLDNAKSADGES